MSAVEDILSQIPLDQLAGQLGVNEQQAEQAARATLPALLGGIQANTEDPGGAASFAQAVQQHDASLVEGGVDLNEVDPQDGQKIVNHVFGAQQDQVVQQLGGLGGVGGSGLIQKLLPILAPIVMAYLAKQLTGATSNVGPGAGADGGLGGLLGGLLGGVIGGGGAPAQQQGGPDLGSILGGLLGGGTRR